MALRREEPEFGHDDEVLLLEPGIMLDKSFANEQSSPRTIPRATTSFPSRQYKHVDYTHALDAMQLYLNKIDFSPLLTPEEEVHFTRLAQRGDPTGWERVIENNLRSVVRTARRYINRGPPLLDLIEEGNLGLIRTVEKFDPRCGFRFSTYTTWWIYQTTERAIMNQARTIRLPIYVVKELDIYLRMAWELTHKLDYKPSPEEIANLPEKPVAKVKRMLGLNKRITSADVSLGPDSDETLLDILTDGCPTSPCELLQDDGLGENIDRWLTEFTDKQREVVVRRFGPREHESNMLEEADQEIGLTHKRAHQVQIETLKHLRGTLEESGLSSGALFR